MMQQLTCADATLQPQPKPGSYGSVPASYTNLAFATGISVADLSETWKQGLSFSKPFEKLHPNARGWLNSYLPGYSKDGARAVVRALVGPWAHAATLTAVLEKHGEKWVVRWYHIARYA